MKRNFIILLCLLSSVCAFGQNQNLEQMLLDKSTMFFNLDVDANVRITIENYTNYRDVFDIAILSRDGKWFHIGTTPELWSYEEARPGGRMNALWDTMKYSICDGIKNKFPTFVLPMCQIAILAKSSRKFGIKIVTSGVVDLVVQIHPVGTRYSLPEAEGIALPMLITSKSQSSSTIVEDEIKGKLQLLKDLYDSGIITKEEFEQRKTMVLNSFYMDNGSVDSLFEAEITNFVRRAGNTYYLQDKCMSKLQYQQFLRENCQSAYKKFTDGLVTSYVGWGLFSAGLAMDLTNMILRFNGESPQASRTFEFCAMGVELASIGLLIGGYMTMHNSVYTYNQTCAMPHPNTYFSINATPGGLSIAYNF